jgi:RNA polymerase sigma factor (sigma-70 family)
MESKLREEPGNLLPATEDCSGVFALEDVAPFYAARRRNLMGQAFAMVRNHAVAEDLIQDAFARLVVEVRGGSTIRSAVKWTSTVLRNLALNHLEHGKVVSRTVEPGSHLQIDSVPDSTASAEDWWLAEETRKHLQEALSQLGPLERECTLMFAEGYSYKEIAIEWQLTHGAAVDVVRRSLRKLRKQFAASRG